MSEETDNKDVKFRINANTLITTVLGALIIFGIQQIRDSSKETSAKLNQTSESLSKIETSVPFMQASVNKLETTVATLVTRSELDSRLKQSDDNHRAYVREIIKPSVP